MSIHYALGAWAISLIKQTKTNYPADLCVTEGSAPQATVWLMAAMGGHPPGCSTLVHSQHCDNEAYGKKLKASGS